MEALNNVVDYGVIGLLLALSVWAVAIAVERWLFYRRVDITQFPNQHLCEIALTRRLVIIGTIAANAPYIGLLGTVAVLAVSGPLAVWSGGHALNVLGWIEIPSPWAPAPRLRSALGAVHVTAVKLLLALFCLHIAGVLKHAVFNRDGTLMRMLRAR